MEIRSLIKGKGFGWLCNAKAFFFQKKKKAKANIDYLQTQANKNISQIMKDS